VTPAEQARKDVEEWDRDCRGAYAFGAWSVSDEDRAYLIARLTPVYERAQEADAADHRCSADLRQRAERAEAERDAWQGIAQDVTRTLIEASDAVPYEGDERAYVRAWVTKLRSAEADAARLREALQSVQHNRVCSCYKNQFDGKPCPRCAVGYDEVDEALAATEPKR